MGKKIDKFMAGWATDQGNSDAKNDRVDRDRAARDRNYRLGVGFGQMGYPRGARGFGQ